MQNALRKPMKSYHAQATENLKSAYRLLWQSADQIDPKQWEAEVYPVIQKVRILISDVSQLNS